MLGLFLWSSVWAMDPEKFEKLLARAAEVQAASTEGKDKARIDTLPSAPRALTKYFHYQSDRPWCGVMTEVGILEAFVGQQFPLDKMLDWYRRTGTLDPSGQGIPVAQLGSALRVKGISSSRRTMRAVRDLHVDLALGHAIMAIVDPGHYWTDTKVMADFDADLKRRAGVSAADHVVWVTGVASDGATVFVNDTAIERGAGLAIAAAEFDRAWHASGRQVIIVERTLPALDPDGDGRPFVDVDGDGYASSASGGDDCDDADAARAPGAPEIAGDKVDQDCDGEDPMNTGSWGASP